MPNFNNWLQTSSGFLGVINAPSRAVIAWLHIQDDPVSIVIYRGSTVLAAQTVRITFDDEQAMDRATPEGVVSEHDLVIFGVRQHPTIADTNIQDGDLFMFGGKNYEMKDVILLPGEAQARGVRRSK